MALPLGIDFRQTAGYVTDPANCVGEAKADGFVATDYSGGQGWGWEVLSPSGMITRDRNTGTPKLAGIHGAGGFSTNDVATFRIDLPSAGSYDIYLAIGDQASQHTNQTVELFDTTSSLSLIVSNGDTLAADKYFDATGVLRTSSADWTTNNAKLTKTFATTILRVSIGPNGRGGNTGDNNVIAHLFVQAAGGASFVAPPVTRTLQAVNRAANF